MKSSILILFSWSTLASSFVLKKHKISATSYRQNPSTSLFSSPDSNEEESPGLILDGLDKELSKMSSKYSITESDFLAAARKRAEMRVASANAGASDEEWKRIAEEKKAQVGEIDDWENSKKEAGNKDSQILMFTDEPVEDENGGDDEPKLLLF